jgi:geranylgeranyl diphosphate/geranylgeranyl-bacteriochlorophyllide a reductase
VILSSSDLPDVSYDVLVVGAGPAGCAAAISLAPGTRALLVERSAPGSRRCCGGLITSQTGRQLERLGLAIPDQLHAEPQPTVVRVHDLDNNLTQSYSRDYLNLDRDRFDDWLIEQAATHADIIRGGNFIERTKTGAILRAGGRIMQVRCPLVIGADGAHSRVRKQCIPSAPKPRVLIAMQAYLSYSRPLTNHEVLFDSRLTDYYAWAICKPEAVIVGCGFHERHDAREKFQKVIDWYRSAFDLGEEALPRSFRYLSQPWSRSQICAGAAGTLLAGEAAGLVSPSSGEGISYALASGIAAGRAATAVDPLSAYKRQFVKLARRVAAKKPKALVTRSPRMRRQALRLPWCP